MRVSRGKPVSKTVSIEELRQRKLLKWSYDNGLLKAFELNEKKAAACPSGWRLVWFQVGRYGHFAGSNHTQDHTSLLVHNARRAVNASVLFFQE